MEITVKKKKKVRHCLTWDALRSDQDFNFYIEDEALKTCQFPQLYNHKIVAVKI